MGGGREVWFCRSGKMTPTKSHIDFLDGLRAIACLTVVYCHLIGWRAPAGSFPTWVAANIEAPLGIIWHFGYFGVAIFFIISGFIISHVSQKEDEAGFALKRLLRIYPTFWVALAVAYALSYFAAKPVNLSGFLTDATLFGSDFRVLGPSYTLVMELLFYGLVACMLPMVRRRPVVAVLAVVILPIVAWKLSGLVTGNPAILGLFGLGGHLPAFAIGMTIYYYWAGRLSIAATAILVGICFGAFAIGTHSHTLGHGFTVSLFYAFLVFLVGYGMKSMQMPKGIKAIALISYSIYLLHAPIGEALLVGKDYWWSIGPALAVIGAASWLSWKLVERPSQDLARWILSRQDPATMTQLVPSETILHQLPLPDARMAVPAAAVTRGTTFDDAETTV